VVVENMTGAGGNLVFNYLAEKALPDGLTIAYSPYQALAQALGDRSLRARFENLEYLGGISDIRVAYMRADAVPGGARKPADIMKADNLIVGAYNHTDFESTLSHLSLDVLGVRHKLVVGYRGGSDIFLAMQRNEVQFHNTSIGTFRTRSATFIKSGEGLAVYYLVSTGPGGEFERNSMITDAPAFPDLYREVHGQWPSGANWDALNWLTTQTSELAYAAFAPRGTPAPVLATLRTAFARAAQDPEFIERSVATNGIPYSPVDVARGRAIISSLAQVSPAVLKALRTAMDLPN
jgi:tripartite-type tricarboxylate transporter receptor subunit TctC